MKNKALNTVLVIMTILSSYTLRSQITTPYPIYNNMSCDIEVAYEVWDTNCGNNCDFGTQIIKPGSSINIGSTCGGIFDVHVVLMKIDGATGVGTPDDVGEMNTSCINSSGPTANGPIPAPALNCSGTWNMAYTPAGTNVW